MLKHKKIKIGKNNVEAVLFKLSKKNLIVFKGRKGYVMCGYLDMKTADKLREAAIRVTGVSSFKDMLDSVVNSCSRSAKKMGIRKGQSVRDALKIIA